MRLVKASEMQEMDRLTIQQVGIPGIVLMENAARAATRLFLNHFAPAAHSRVLVLCGRGNNGGDGYVMARYLHQGGLKVTLAVLSELQKIVGDAGTNLEIIGRIGLEALEVPGPDEWGDCRGIIAESDFVIDGILGTGLNSAVRGFYRRVIEEVNDSGKPVMSIDIPSGLNADSGQVMGAAIKADLTVTFGFPKLGQLLFPGAEYCGRLARVQIGIPDTVADQLPAKFHLIEPKHFTDLFKTEKADIHKGGRGHLLILSGSTGKTGAATLTAFGALRAGAGLVTVGVPESLNEVLENKLTEAMTQPLPETGSGSLSLKAEEEVKRLMEGKSALALGPGLSTNEETSRLVRRIVKSCTIPIVIDADGLNALSVEPGVLSHCAQRAILTPHPGEMGRLTGMSSARVQEDRVGVANDFVKKHGCHLVLKGARTLVALPQGDIYVNPTGNPALASGGSGDVLTGFIGGFLARGWPLEKAALGGVYLHGLSADLLAEEMGQAGILAGELPDVLPELTSSLMQGQWPLEAPAPHEDLYHPL